MSIINLIIYISFILVLYLFYIFNSNSVLRIQILTLYIIYNLIHGY